VILKAKDLTKNFGGLSAINNVSFHIKEGEILGIIGPNGAGKSTLFDLLTGVQPPTEGEIEYNNENITGLKTYELAIQGMARTYQTTKLFNKISVKDNILVGMISRTRHNLWSIFVPKREKIKILHDDLEKLLDFIGLKNKKDLIADQLDQEAQKRLAIGVALATKPKLLFLDEPTGGINVEEINRLIGLIAKIKNSGITVCLIEHKMKMVMELCERIMVLNYGKLIAEGTPQEIRSNEVCIQAYLGEEYAA